MTYSMIPKECKRLAEVDFPIAVVSKHSAREKSIRHGHPSTLHLWWARRPLAACRSMLMALLLPDPCDPNCPADFKQAARRIMLEFPARPQRWDEELSTEPLRPKARAAGKTGEREDSDRNQTPDERLRRILLHEFIADFADWDNSANPAYLKTARALVKAAHGDEAPLVVDPFAGGGSIPLEALRIGCEAFASDLNPVACLILKVMLEDIPRHGPELAEELRRVGKQIKEQAEKELTDFYPQDPDGAKPIAYLWARTVRCESPNCGAEIPLMRSFWLCKKDKRKRALRYNVVRPNGQPPRIEFEVFEPTSDGDLPPGTVTRAKATCPCCNVTLPPDRVRAQLAEQRGGADVVFDDSGHRTGGATMLAVVTLSSGTTGRSYRLPTQRDYEAVWNAQQRLNDVLHAWESNGRNGLCPVPDEPLPPIGTLGFRVQRYGMLQWGDVFTARQALGFATLSSLIRGPFNTGTTKPIGSLIAMICTKLVDRSNSLVNWSLGVECPNQVFKGTALPIGWDFCESNILSESSASIDQSVNNIATNTIASCILGSRPSSPQVADARCSSLPDESTSVWFTDPPYYDAVPYSDLSDFFFVWFKRVLPEHPLLRDPFDSANPLTPKTREIVQDETKRFDGRVKDRVFFEDSVAHAFAEGRRILNDKGIGCVVFAHKTTEGWEALLSGMIRGGWVITGSWPIATERYSRFRARESAALATSVHLVCRPRPEDAGVGDWGDMLRELPPRVGDWMERLQGEGVRGADLVFACIGPALEIFSRYSKVETAEGEEVSLATYLEKVWEVVGRTALEQVLGTAEAKARNGMALPDRQAGGAVEEDARLTALFLWTLQSTNAEAASNDDKTNGDDEDSDEASSKPSKGLPAGRQGYTLIFDVVRRFAQPLGIRLEDWAGRIIETKKGVVRLLSVGERAKQLFGEDGASAVADRIESDARQARNTQMMLFPDGQPVPKVRGRGRARKAGADVSDEALRTRREATTLDRVHAAMLLQAGGRANALRALLKAEQNRSPDFLRLANALSALYPRGSEEKRLLDAMLLAVPR